MHNQFVVLQIKFWSPSVFFAKQRGPQSKISVKTLLLLFVDHRQLFGCLGRQAAGSNRSALVSFPGSTGYRLQFQTPAYKRQVATYAGGFPAYRFPRGRRANGCLHCVTKNPAGIAPVPRETSLGPRNAAPETPLSSERSGSPRGRRGSAPPVLASISGPCPSSNSNG
jgi:hypothetical protein